MSRSLFVVGGVQTFHGRQGTAATLIIAELWAQVCARIWNTAQAKRPTGRRSQSPLADEDRVHQQLHQVAHYALGNER